MGEAGEGKGVRGGEESEQRQPAALGRWRTGGQGASTSEQETRGRVRGEGTLSPLLPAQREPSALPASLLALSLPDASRLSH